MNKTKRIPLRVSGGENVVYNSWPITQGIPFAEGELEAGCPVRVVNSEGTPLPTQARCLSSWHPDGKHVRWLLVDFQADLSPRNAPAYFLEYGPSATPPAHTNPIKIGELENILRVDTGVLQFDFRNTPFSMRGAAERDVLRQCRVSDGNDWRDMFRGSPGPHLYMRDQYGALYTSAGPGLRPETSDMDGPCAQIVIEESGPLRTAIRIKGCHASERGIRFCPYILRAHFFAGRRDVRFQHTFIFDQDPHSIELSSIGMRFPLNLGEAPRLATGADQGAPIVAQGKKSLVFLQSDDQTFETRVDGVRSASGVRTLGWSSIGGNRGGVTAVMKNCWQEYPKGFALSPDGLDAQIWPESFPTPLNFTSPFEQEAVSFGGLSEKERFDEEVFKRKLAEKPGAPIALKTLGIKSQAAMLFAERMVEKYGAGRAVSYNDLGEGNGLGAAKTTEIWLRFAAAAIPDNESESFAACVQEPMIAPADPAYACGTGALGCFHHSGDARFSQTNADLDFLVEEIIEEPRRLCRRYGMMVYGNMVGWHAPGPGFTYLHYKESDPAKALRYVGPYNNEANDHCMAVWGNFLRTGRHDHFSIAQAYSRVLADVAIYHTNPEAPANTGTIHYHSAHQWSGIGSASHTVLPGLIVDYCLTGDQRLKDVIDEVGNWLLSHQTPAGILACTRVLNREYVLPLANLMSLYRLTWQERYGDMARRTLNWLLRALPRPGAYPVSIFTAGERGDEAVVGPDFGCGGWHARDIYQLLSESLYLFDSQTLREHILAEANAYVWDFIPDGYMTREQARRFMQPGLVSCWDLGDGFLWIPWKLHGYSYNVALLCVAYALTGDMIYAAVAKHYLDHVFPRQMCHIRHKGDWGFDRIQSGSYIPRLMGLMAQASAADPEGLQKAEERWLRERAERGNPIYRGKGVDLSKDTMDSIGSITSRASAEAAFEAPVRPTGGLRNIGRLSTADHPAPVIGKSG